MGGRQARLPAGKMPALLCRITASCRHYQFLEMKKNVPYTVPKLKDFSVAALEKAADNLLAVVRREAEEISSESEGKVFRDRWMARKNGILTQVNDLWLKAAPKEAKRDVGQRVNEVKKQVE
jgi:hypothetical protein